MKALDPSEPEFVRAEAAVHWCVRLCEGEMTSGSPASIRRRRCRSAAPPLPQATRETHPTGVRGHVEQFARMLALPLRAGPV